MITDDCTNCDVCLLECVAHFGTPQCLLVDYIPSDANHAERKEMLRQKYLFITVGLCIGSILKFLTDAVWRAIKDRID